MAYKRCLALLSALLLAGNCLLPVTVAQNEVCQTFKVCIGSNPKEFTLGSSGDYQLIDPGSGKQLYAGSKEIKCKVTSDSTKYYSVFIDTFYTYDDADNFGLLLSKRFPADPGRRVLAVNEGYFKLEMGTFKTEDEAKTAISTYLNDIPKAVVSQTDAYGISLGDSLALKPPIDKTVWQFLIVKPTSQSSMPIYNGRRYRGKISLYMSGKNFYVVNELPFEDYLKGVVPSEMPAGWPLEALKVQAVCARNYAYVTCSDPANSCFNIGSTDGYQVYIGYEQETERSNQAVDETTGMMAIYNNKPIVAYFHSTSGGMTENSEFVWSSALPYCKAVDSPGEEESPHYAWMKFIGLDELKSNLSELTGDIGDIVAFKNVKKGISGRVKTCEIKGTKGIKTLNGENVMYTLGLRSTWFDFVFITGGVVACGRGWGHGIGMSQYGSKAMAVAGKKYVDIVKHYFTGVEVKKWY